MKLTDYIQGKRRGPEANKLEREAMDNPFLQEAMDGFDAVSGDHLQAIGELESQLQQKLTRRRKVLNYRLWALTAAASVVLFLGIGGLLYFEMKQPDHTAFRAPQKVLIAPKDTAEIRMPFAENATKVLAQEIKKRKPVSYPENRLTQIAIPENTQSLSVSDSNRQMELASVPAQQKTELNVAEPIVMTIKPESIENALQGKVAGLMIRGISSVRQADIADVKNEAEAKPGIIKGKVTDLNAEPIIGASVRIKGKKEGVCTDINGNFEIPATVGQDKLEVSYIGFDKQEINTSADSNIIRLKESQLALNEVVVVGFGAQKKRSITGSVSSNAVTPTFAEPEFRKYFDSRRSKAICDNVKGSLKVEFKIDANGKPTGLNVLKCNCPELEEEFKALLDKSPKWTQANRRVRMIITL